MNRIFIGLAALFFMSCTATKKVTMNEPTLFQKWDLTMLNGDSITNAGHKKINIQFSDSANRVFGSGPCNRFFSGFTRSGNTLKFTSIGSTKMSCGNEANQLEVKFFQALDKVDGYKFIDGNLVLTAGGKDVATFAISKSVPDDLVGKWELFYITGRRIAFNGLYPDRKPSLTFTRDTDEFGGNTSCNTMSATYIGKKDGPLFKPGIMTLRACPGEGEQVFLDAFKKVDRYDVSGDTLSFFINAIEVMKFKKVHE